MDSLGDYIYLIILVVAGLSGILKKKKTATENTAPATPKHSWKDILKELTPIEEEEIKPEVQEIHETPANEKTKPAMAINYKTIDDVSKSRSQRHSTTIASSNKSYSNLTRTEKSSYCDNEYLLDSTEKARKAFIFSEIFNRKY